MSIAQPLRPRRVGRTNFNFAIVASQYNLIYVQAMVEQAQREIIDLEPGATKQIIWASGAFEIPLLAKLALNQKKFDAVLALGVLLKGETDHAMLVAQSVTSALQDLALEFTTPVINAVLLVENEEQAQVRCMDLEHNRGVEAGRAAVATARTVRELIVKIP